MTGREPSFRKTRRLAGALCLAVLAVAPGCVYLRLLEIKKQLKDFDQNFAITGRSELVIEFKDPVLKIKDVKFLIGADPLYQTEEGEDIYHYEFDQVRAAVPAAPDVFIVVGSTGPPQAAAAPPPLHHLSLRMAFREVNLVRIIIPETFMLLFPRNVLVETLRQAADAEVYESRRLARGRIKLPLATEAELPSLSKTIFLLGEPLERVPEGDLETIVYRYEILKGRRQAPIKARLSFDVQGLLRRVFVRWDISSVETEFLRD